MTKKVGGNQDRPKPGRPTDLTPEVIAEFARVLPAVMYLDTAGDYIGVERTTWRKWLKRGAAEAKRLRKASSRPIPEEALYLEFFHTHKRALAEGTYNDCENIRLAGSEQWQASAWRLERRSPDKWGRDRDLLKELVKRVKELEERLGGNPPPPASEG